MAEKKQKGTIQTVTHPVYDLLESLWTEFRYVFEGGKDFREEYLKEFSTREDATDFAARKLITPIPSHAKSAILEIKNAIYQRMVEITRKGGPNTYQSAIKGEEGGVDLCGNTMNGFIGGVVLPELLALSKIGVFIDKPFQEDENNTLADKGVIRPYLYIYKAEDIRSWQYDSQNQLNKLLLRHITYDENEESYGLPSAEIETFKLIQKVETGIEVMTFDEDGIEIDQAVIINIPMIPFVIFDITTSLLADVGSYQIALLNLASADMNYAVKANFPFYVEQIEPFAEMGYIKSTGDGTAEESKTSQNKEVNIGPAQGRQYAKGLEAPSFIHPSPAPLEASMLKQENLKKEIRQLVHLALTQIEPKQASRESKEKDDTGLEAGLSFIGLELEHGEAEIAKIWSTYENRSGKSFATIKYPRKYSLKTDKDRRDEAKEKSELLPSIPSITAQKEMAKDITENLIGMKVSNDELEKIKKEIDSALVINIDPAVISIDHEKGFVSTKTASLARLYPKGEVEKAKKDHAERLARIAESQSKDEDLKNPESRGIKDEETGEQSPKEEKEESRVTDKDAVITDKTRGEA